MGSYLWTASQAVVWNGCLTGNSGQCVHTLHSFIRPERAVNKHYFPSVGIKEECPEWREAGLQTTQFKREPKHLGKKDLVKKRGSFQDIQPVSILFPRDKPPQGTP